VKRIKKKKAEERNRRHDKD